MVAVNFQPQQVWKLPGRSSRRCYQFSLPATLCTALSRRGCMYNSCVQSAMLHANETWPLTKPNRLHLQQKDMAMIRQLYNLKLQDNVTIRCNELLAQLGIEDLDLILKERRLHSYGHLERSNGAVKIACHIEIWWWWWWKGTPQEASL